MRRAAPLTAILALLSVCVTPAVWSLNTLEVNGAMIWIGNADPDSAPSPLLPALGMNFPIVSRRFWGFDTGFLVTGAYYGYVGDRAIPAELEHRDFAVPLILGDARAGLHWPLGERVRIDLTGGLLLLLRVPIPLFPDASADFGSASVYLLERAAYPQTELSVRFPILPAFDLCLGVRAGWPWFHYWDGEPYAFWDQLVVTGVLGVVYHTKSKMSTSRQTFSWRATSCETNALASTSSRTP